MMQKSESPLAKKLLSGEGTSPNLVQDDDELRRLISGLSLDNPANRAVLSDKMEELSRTAEAKLLRSQHPAKYNYNAPGVSPVLTAGKYVEGADEDDQERGLEVYWGAILLGTIEATQRKGIPGLSYHWRKEGEETTCSWVHRVLRLDLDEQESVRITYLLWLACAELYEAWREDEDY
jgi:hypothetical protein